MIATVAKSMDLLNFLIDGVEIPLDNHIKLLITLFLSLLAEKPHKFGINVTVKCFKILNYYLTICPARLLRAHVRWICLWRVKIYFLKSQLTAYAKKKP